MLDTTTFQLEVARILGCPDDWVHAKPSDQESGAALVIEICPRDPAPNRRDIGVRYLVQVTSRAMSAWGVRAALQRACAAVRGELELDGHLHAVRCDRDEALAITSALARLRMADRFAYPPPPNLSDPGARRRDMDAMTNLGLVVLSRDLGQAADTAHNGVEAQLAQDLTQLAGHALAMAIGAQRVADHG